MYYILRSESFEEIFRRKRERKDRSSKMDDRWWNNGKNDRSTINSRSAIWVQRFFSPPLSLSLSVSVLSISRCGLKILHVRRVLLRGSFVLHANARRWRKSDRAVCRLFEAESGVCHGCVFSEPVRHPSRRSAGH